MDARNEQLGSTTVWVASWDVHNSGTGVEVFRTKEAAVEKVLAWAKDFVDVERLGAEFRTGLASDGFLELPDQEVCYGIEECVIQDDPHQTVHRSAIA